MTVYVYADVTLFIAILTLVPMLWGIARAYTLRFSLRRCIASAILGGVMTVIAVALQFKYILMLGAAMASFTLMIYIAFGSMKLRLMLKAVMMLIAESVTLGGFSVFVGSITEQTNTRFLSLGCVIIGVFLLGVSLRISRSARLSAYESGRKDAYSIFLSVNGKSEMLQAMLDTGNTLTEPISQCPVMIMNSNKARDKFGIETEGINKNKRTVPYSSPSSNGFMECIKADEIRIEQNGKWHDAGDVYIAFSDNIKCDALIGLAMLK